MHTNPAGSTAPRPNAWHERADELARWAMTRLVNRTDRCGVYYVTADKKTAQCADPRNADAAKDGFLRPARLVRHFKATATGAVLGVYSYGREKMGRWCGIDIDAHPGADADALANERLAVDIYRQCVAIGLTCLLYESNGRGGFHLWIIFADPVPAVVLRALGLWLLRDHAHYGFTDSPEVFPKSTDKPWGNWLRLPGRHHTRDVWPRVWTGAEWVRDAAAVEHVLSLAGCRTSLIPEAAIGFGYDTHPDAEPAAPKRAADPDWVHPYQDFNAKATTDNVVQILERAGWSRGRTGGAVEMVRPGKNPRDGQGGNVKAANGTTVFYVHTTGDSVLRGPKGYNPTSLIALLEHGGDFKAANRALYDSGFGTRVQPKPTGPRGAGGASPTAAAKPVVPEPRPGGMLVETLVGIVPKPVAYLVPDRIPSGMMGLLAGEGGHGKSVTTLHLAAAVSTGRCAFGLDYPNPARGKVLLISCEDDWQRTVVPRLAAFGADFNRLLRVKGVRMKDGGEVLDFHLGHFRELETLLISDPEIRLVIIDPAGAYIGRAGVNENKDAELRTILGPLSEAANRTGAAILLVKHLNKSAGVSAVQRVSGSAGYVNAVRFAYMFSPDPDDTGRKLMLPIKANVLKSGSSGLAYRLSPMDRERASEILFKQWPTLNTLDGMELAGQLVSQDWEGEVETTADSVVGMGRRSRAIRGPVDCEEFIRKYLGAYSHPDKELITAAKAEGYGFTLIKQTKAKMRAMPDDQRLSGEPIGKGGAWWVWIGPLNRPRDERPEPKSGAA